MKKIDDALEALAKIEIKLDGLLHVVAQLVMQLGGTFDISLEEGYHCPICSHPVRFMVNPMSGGVIRACKCGTKLVPAPTQEEIQKMLEMGVEKPRKEKDDGGSEQIWEELESIQDRQTPGSGEG